MLAKRNLGSQILLTIVDSVSGTVKDTTQDIARDGDTQTLTSELDTGLLNINTRCTFENLANRCVSCLFCDIRQGKKTANETYLDDGTAATDLKNLTGTDGSVRKGQVDNLVVTGELKFEKMSDFCLEAIQSNLPATEDKINSPKTQIASRNVP